MANGAWLALGAAALAAGASSVRGGANRRVGLKRGDRVAYNPMWVKRRPLGPQTKASALAMRGVVVDVSGALTNVRWDGSEQISTHDYPVEIVKQEALAASSPRAPSWDDMVLTRRGELLTPDGPIPLKPIGKGMFSKIYRQDTPDANGHLGRVVAIVGEGVWDKEIMADAHEAAPDNPHLPAVERLGMLSDGRRVYVMPHYAAPYRKGNAKASDHKAFQAIRKCVSETWSGLSDQPHHVLDCIREAGIDHAIVDAVEVLADTASNYGDSYKVEFSPSNTATDKDGNLVLLDLLFDRDAVRKSFQQKRKKAGW